MRSRQAIGMSTLNAAAPVIVTRYFSRKIAHRITIVYVLISASLSAIGVPTSPGSMVMAADAAVAAAASPTTVVFFPSR